ncbi:MAG: TetR/AcrR family transcriptional regulator [Parvibaculaceae bacterium]|nr:TetR/AcrR family transcriptional regulator [Parvibaculaceae bacterium]
MNSPTTDGRQQRSSRSRDKIVNAVLDLIRKGNMKPTGNEIAETAGISPRTVFRLFGDIESLFSACEDNVLRFFEQSTIEVDRSASLHERVWSVAEEKCKSFDERRNFTLFYLSRVQSDLETNHTSASQAENERLELWAALPEVVALEANARHLVEVMYSSRCWDQLRYAQNLTSAEALNLIASTVISIVESGSAYASVTTAAEKKILR